MLGVTHWWNRAQREVHGVMDMALRAARSDFMTTDPSGGSWARVSCVSPSFGSGRHYCPRVRILVLGAAGMLGRRLVERLGRDGTLGTAPIQQLVLADIVEPERPSSALDIETVGADLAVPKAAESLLSTRPDVVFHLAAVYSYARADAALAQPAD